VPARTQELERLQGIGKPTVKCVICKTGGTEPGVATVMLARGTTAVIIKNVPAEICSNCGEYYLSENVSQKVYSQAEEAVRRRAEIEVVQYVAYRTDCRRGARTPDEASREQIATVGGARKQKEKSPAGRLGSLSRVDSIQKKDHQLTDN